MKRRILRVITRVNIGGPSRHVRLLMEGLDPARFEQRLLAGVCESNEAAAPFAADVVDAGVPSLVRSIRPLADLRALRAVRAEIEGFRPDLVHTHQAKAGFIGRLGAWRAGVPRIVHTYHGHTFEGYWGPARGALFRRLERFLARRSSALVVQSDSQARDIERHLGAAARGKLRLIPPGIDFDDLDRAGGSVSALRSQLGLTDQFVVVFAARLAPVKNGAGFLRVLKRVVDQSSAPLAAVIVGGGGEASERELHDIVDELGLRRWVRWLGYRSDMRTVYELADLVALTSHREGTPLVLLEALACGAAVAAYDVGGVSDIIRGRPGADLVAPDDEEAFAAVVSRRMAASDPRDPSRASSAVREEFGRERLLRDVERLYESL